MKNVCNQNPCTETRRNNTISVRSALSDFSVIQSFLATYQAFRMGHSTLCVSSRHPQTYSIPKFVLLHLVSNHRRHSLGTLASTHRLKRAARVGKGRQFIQLKRGKLHNRRWQITQARLNATRHVLRRDLVDQANDVLLRSACEFTAGDTTDSLAGGPQRVEIIRSHVPAQQHGVHPIHGDKVISDVRERKGMLAVMPLIREPFSARELKFRGRGACIRLHGTEEGADVLQVRRCGVAAYEIREEPE